MNRPLAGLERQRLARCRLLAELRHRRLLPPDGWSHCGAQFGTDPDEYFDVAADKVMPADQLAAEQSRKGQEK